MRSLEDHLFAPGRKRVLALDGGGVRGVMTCCILEKLEATLRERLPPDKQAAFRLCDYFDVIGGTSTGSIIASWLALGHTASETRELYVKFAAKVFKNASPWSWIGLTSKFSANGLHSVIREAFRTYAQKKGLGDEHNLLMNDRNIRTGLVVFTKRIDKASPWVIHNNPHGKFWDQEKAPWKDYFEKHEIGRPNWSLELAKVVQASASAPYYLDSIDIRIKQGEDASFIDGGVSPHNNPSLYMMAMLTMDWKERATNAVGKTPPNDVRSPFGFGFETGEDKLLFVSLGTGMWRKTKLSGFWSWLAAPRALHALTTMMDDASQLAVTLMQSLGRSLTPSFINYELEGMEGLGIGRERLYSYLRIDAKLDAGEDGILRTLGVEPFLAAMGKPARKTQPKTSEQQKLVATRRAALAAKLQAKALRRARKMDNPKRSNLRVLQALGERVGEMHFGTRDMADRMLPRSFDPWS